MRSIRALYNHAIRRNIVKESLYLFRAYKASRLKGRGAKWALTFEEVKQIINVDLSENPELLNSKNYLVFSFYTRGMNFADMMKLKWRDIKGRNIYYTRSKTGVAITQYNTYLDGLYYLEKELDANREIVNDTIN